MGGKAFNFTRLGVRVPTILVSPWIEKGTVVGRPEGPTSTSQYEHSSLPATLKTMFDLEDYLTARDKWAGNFEFLFNQRTTPRTDCPTKLPDPVIGTKKELKKWKESGTQRLSGLQKSIMKSLATINGNPWHELKHPIKTEAEGAAFIDYQMKKFYRIHRP